MVFRDWLARLHSHLQLNQRKRRARRRTTNQGWTPAVRLHQVEAFETRVLLSNVPPTANPGGPYNIAVNNALSLSGSASYDPDYAPNFVLDFAWDLDYDGVTFDVNLTGEFAAADWSTLSTTYGYSAGNSYTVALRVDDGADTDIATTTVNVAANVPPTANAGGPYNLAVNNALSLSGSSSYDPDYAPNFVLDFAWDLDYDGVTFDANLTGEFAAADWATLSTAYGYSAANSYTVALRVDDGADTHVATTTVNVAANVPPTANPSGPYNIAVNDTLSLSGSSSYDPDYAPNFVLDFAWDLDYDGVTFDANLTGEFASADWATLSTAFGYTACNSYTVALRVDDGAATHVATALVHVASNVPPTANAGGPYNISSGETLALSGSGSIDPDYSPNMVLSYEWDLDYDGVTFDVNQTGEFVSVDWSTLSTTHGYSAGNSYTVGLRVNDGAATDVAATTVSVVGNQPPTASDDSFGISEDDALSVSAPGVLGNDSDPEAAPLTAVLISDVINGTLWLNSDGSFAYTPFPDFNGTDSFTYKAHDGAADSNIATVSITVEAMNDAPEALGENYLVPVDGLLSVSAPGVLGNDIDWDDDPLTAVLLSGPSSGTLTLNSDGSLTYAPNPGFEGTDHFTYAANDGTSESAAADVTILVGNAAPSAGDDFYTVTHDQSLVVGVISGVLTNDSDPNADPLTASLVTGVANGSLVLSPDGSFAYMPNPGFLGVDQFTYVANDGTAASNTATVTIVIWNSTPAAVGELYSTVRDQPVVIDAANGLLANDIGGDADPLSVALLTGVTNGTLTLVADGLFTYTPTAGFVGGDSFTYQVSDGFGSDSATVQLKVSVPPFEGDGNADGIPDNQQPHVESFWNPAGSGYLTLVGPATSEIVITETFHPAELADPPSGVLFPAGAVAFEIQQIPVGSAVTATLTVNEPVRQNFNSFYQFGPTPDDPNSHWYEFLYDPATGTGATISGNVVTLHYVDGGRGDHDLTANGVIVDPGIVTCAPFPEMCLTLAVQLDVTGSGDSVRIQVTGNNVEVRINNHPASPSPPASQVNTIRVEGGSGNNDIDLSPLAFGTFPNPISVSVNGNGGNDTITGSGYADYLEGGDGPDFIQGKDAGDEIHGNAGNDTLWGDGGSDCIFGGAGDDTLWSGSGGAETPPGSGLTDTEGCNKLDNVFVPAGCSSGTLPTVSITANDAAAAEGTPTNTGQFTVTRTGTSGNLTVYYTIDATVANPATNTADYANLPGNIQILNGQSTATITVTPVDDVTSEPTENVRLVLSADAAYTIHATDNAATVTIADNDGATLPTVSITANDAAAAEGTPTNTGQFTVTRTGTSGNLTVYYTIDATVANPATNTADYANLPGNIQILNGQSTATITVTPVDDVTSEPTENVRLVLSADAAYTVHATNNAATVTIADNDGATLPTVSITANDAAAAEGTPTNTGQFTVTRTGTSGNLTVYYTIDATVANPATNTADYANLPGNIQILNGQSTATITVTPVDDVTSEPTENVRLVLSADAAYTIHATDNAATVTIADNDGATLPTVSITANDAAAAEGTPTNTGQFTVTRTGTSGDLTVQYTIDATVANPATNTADYANLPGSIQILNGQTGATITVTPVDDTTAEPTENVRLVLSANAAYTIHATDGAATVTIADNDGATLPTVSITANDAAAAEGTPTNTGQFTVTRTGTSGNLTVYYTIDATVANPATNTADYANLPGNIQILNGQSTATITVTPVDDVTSEPTENVRLVLSADAAYTIHATDNAATVTIADNDGPTTPSISINDVTVTEGNTGTIQAAFTVSLSAASATDVTVKVQTANGTATVSNNDYEAVLLTTLTFTAGGALTQTVNVTVNGDTVGEPNETFYVNLSNPTNATISDSQGKGTITNDDNRPPIAVDDDYRTNPNVSLNAPAPGLLANDSDPDGDMLTAVLVTGPSSGTLTLNSTGSFTYTPAAGFVGVATFEYKVNDGLADSPKAIVRILVSSITQDPYGGRTNQDDLFHGDSYLRDGYVSQSYDIKCGCHGPEVSLNYNSMAADPNVVLGVNTTFLSGAPFPNAVTGQLVFRDSSRVRLTQSALVYYNTSGFAAGNGVRFVLSHDMSAFPTGRYAYDLELISFVGVGSEPVLRVFSGAIDFVNASFRTVTMGGSPSTEYLTATGVGWQVSGVPRLIEQTDGVLLNPGDGSAVWFAKSGSTFTHTPGIFATLERTATGFKLTDKFFNRYDFDHSGLVTRHQDRNDNTTTYTYTDGSGNGDADEISQILDPTGRITQFNYVSNFLWTIQDFAGRTYTLTNTDGTVTSITAPDPDGSFPAPAVVTNFQYDDNRRLKRVGNSLGLDTEFKYHPFSRRNSQELWHDHAVTYGGTAPDWKLVPLVTQGLVDLTTSVGTSPNPAPLARPSDALAHQTDPGNNLWRYETDRFGNVTKRIDPVLVDGADRTWQFDRNNPDGLLAKVVRPGETTATYNFPQTEIRYEYDVNGNLTKITFPDTKTQQWTYDPQFSQMATFTDERNFVYTYAVNLANGNRSSMTEPHPGNSTQISPLGSHPAPFTTYTYTTTGIRGLLATVTEPDPDGPGGDGLPVTTYQYDAYGRLWKVFPPVPAGAPTIYEEFLYDATDALTSYRDERGNTTGFENDVLGRPFRITDAQNRATQINYNNLGKDPRVTLPDPDGSGPLPAPVMRYAYDPRGRLKQYRDPDPDGGGPLGSPITDYAYDKFSRLASVTAPINSSSVRALTQYGFDEVGRLNRTTLPDPNPSDTVVAPFITYAYDALDRLRTLTQPDPDGPGTQYSSTAVTYGYHPQRDWLTSIADPTGTTSFYYDPAGSGNLFSISRGGANGMTTRFRYDNLNRVTKEFAQDLVRQFGYAPNGNLIRYKDRNSRFTDFDYDLRSRLTHEKWLNGLNTMITYGYDAASNLTSASMPGSAPTAIVPQLPSNYVFVYDTRNQLDNSTYTGPLPVYSIFLDYTPDRIGRFIQTAAKINTTSNTSTNDFLNKYQYDGIGRVTRIEQMGQGGNIVAAKRVDLKYNNLSQFETITRYADLAGNQLVAQSTYGYDPANRLTNLTHVKGPTTLAGYSLTYDDLNRVTTFTGTGTGLPTETQTYTYDPISQLQSSTGTMTAAENYTYDADGNRTNSGYAIDPTNKNDRMSSDGTYNYEYDNEGNRILRTHIASGTKTFYLWDHRNRLIRVDFRTSGLALLKRVEYSYDAFDRRIYKRVDDNGNGTFDRSDAYVYDGPDIVLVYSDLNNSEGLQTATLSHRYLHGPDIDQVFADESSVDGLLWALADHQGSVRTVVEYNAATDTTSVEKRVKYTAFGTIKNDTNSHLKFLYAFTGREWDPDVGLHYYRARWHDPLVGRFLSQDPIGFAGGDANLYRYVGNSATNFTDPSGLESLGWSMTKAFGAEFFFHGPNNLAIGAFQSAREVVYYGRDVAAVGGDAVATWAGHPLRVDEWSGAGKSNRPNNRDFWQTSIKRAGRAGAAGLTLGSTEIAVGTYDFARTGDSAALQQHMGGVAGTNLATAGMIKGIQCLRTVPSGGPSEPRGLPSPEEAAFNEFFRSPMRDPPPVIPQYNRRMPRFTPPEPNGDFIPRDPRFRPGPAPPFSSN